MNQKCATSDPTLTLEQFKLFTAKALLEVEQDLNPSNSKEALKKYKFDISIF